MSAHTEEQSRGRLATLVIGALGVVFGDIGTSPLYALKEALGSHGSAAPTEADVLGVLSLIFWSLVVVITVKYVFYIMRADNKGEGGIMALAALALRSPGVGPNLRAMIYFLSLCGLALFFGDGVITPAISVLSAVEGLELATPVLKPAVLPVTVAILIGLFLFQRRGTGGVGQLFGPVMVVWFIILAALGIYGIVRNPTVLAALSPLYAIQFFLIHGGQAFLVLGAVFLAVTGAETLYADMGHFGRRAIKGAWLFLVFPSLVLNYFGQGSLILQDAESLRNPFYLLAPSWGLYPLVFLSTAATVIASQAVISGAFSAARQAMNLGFLPRMAVVHTSTQEEGQIYVPVVNWALLLAVLVLVVSFKSSSNLASAYGIAVTGAMAIDTTLAFGLVLRASFSWKPLTAALVTGFFLFFDLTFFAANCLKIPEGGWFPLVLGTFIFYFMATWKNGLQLALKAVSREEIPLEPFLRQFEKEQLPRVPGTAIYLTGRKAVVPRALVQNLQHHWVAHERVVLVTVTIQDTPFLSGVPRVVQEDLGQGFHRLEITFGFSETPDLLKAMQELPLFEGEGLREEASFFLGRATFLPMGGYPGFPIWRQRFFIWLQHTSGHAAEWFNLPMQRVVEMGSRLAL
ncbi:MAG: potassium transporter Kup [Magnetococcales bacterium]|nr:potassium transporter Kup [Magnetococcales bacterium]